MKKHYKMLDRDGRIFLLRWQTDGVLFGPDWSCISEFDRNAANLDRCRKIIMLMNECDLNTNGIRDD